MVPIVVDSSTGERNVCNNYFILECRYWLCKLEVTHAYIILLLWLLKFPDVNHLNLGTSYLYRITIFEMYITDINGNNYSYIIHTTDYHYWVGEFNIL